MAKKLKIGGHDFTLSVGTTGSENYAEMDPSDNSIVIASHLSDSLKASTLLHEVMHGMNTTIHHEFLDSLAEQMYQFLVENGLWNDKRAKELLS